MRQDLEQLLKAANVQRDDPLFWQKTIKALWLRQKDDWGVWQDPAIDLPQMNACLLRNINMARRLAYLLINDQGIFQYDVLVSLKSYFADRRFLLDPIGYHDVPYINHVVLVLDALIEEKNLVTLIKTIDRPTNFIYAEQLIRDTLQLPHGKMITDVEAKRSVLTALFTRLRQTVGSCFATAPAILIQSQQFQQLVIDLRDLLSSGRLKRTIDGVEHSVPLSASWGMGELRRPIWLDPEGKSLANSLSFISTLVACGLLDPSMTPSDQYKQTLTIIQNTIKEVFPGFTGSTVTVEKILKSILMHTYNLSQADVDHQESPPPELFSGSILAIVPKVTAGRRSKIADVAKFQTQFQLAKAAYRSLSDNALLKAWEYTLASFSESKAQFSKWNLYASLGLDSKEEGGIGQCLYDFLKVKLDEFNAVVNEYQTQYEKLFLELKALESMMRDADSQQKLNWRRADYHGRSMDYNLAQDKRDAAHENAIKCRKLYPLMLEKYLELFPMHFQEVYDADMQGVEAGIFADSPAGFRLIAKHGRSHPSTWTLIQNSQQFIQVLCEFFVMTEHEIALNEDVKGIENLLSQAVTELVLHLKTKTFIDSAFQRIAKAHDVPIINNPLDNLEKVSVKPWAYVSGGTMDTLVQVYFGLNHEPTTEQRWVESETELLVFLIDVMKNIPPTVFAAMQQNSGRFLMNSPSHAFILEPNRQIFSSGWKADDAYTYTWVRDNYINPCKSFYEEQKLNEGQINWLVDKICLIFSQEMQPLVKKTLDRMASPLNPQQFWDLVLQRLSSQSWGKNLPAVLLQEIEGLLFESLPLTPQSDLQKNILNIFSRLPNNLSMFANESSEIANYCFNSFPSQFLTPFELLSIIIAMLNLLRQTPYSSNDDYGLVCAQMRELKLAAPEPLIFADSNWAEEVFGFIVSPVNFNLTFWRLDTLGLHGRQMLEWRRYLNGKDQKKWTVYTRPHEYRTSN
ncbi:MAG: hypothetical protein JHC93_04025 [Parachlamydiales bacterium]|nr:hypothetical protein [Parachlamydiales bacterium]